MVTLIVGLNVLVFLQMTRLIDAGQIMAYVDRYAISADGLKAGRWWQPLTHLFLHGGDAGLVMRLSHLVLNMLVIFTVGRELLEEISTRAWIILYFFSGMLGGFFQILVTPHSPLLGASGAAFGLMAAYTSMHAHELIEAWVLGFPVKVNAGSFCKALILSSALLGLISLVSTTFIPLISNMGHFAHLGGAIGGVIFARIAGRVPSLPTKKDLERERAINDARLENNQSSDAL